MTTQEINARIDEAIKETTDKFEALRKEFIKPKYETGKWYKSPGITFYAFVFLTKEYGYGKVGYGIDGCGKWTNEWYAKPDTDGLIEATPSEVLKALKKEAVKRGLVAGAKIKQGHYTIPNNAVYNLSLGCLHIGNVIIMDSNGYWAEVVKHKSTSDYVNEYLSRPNVDLMEFLDSNNLKIVPNA